MHAMDVLRLLSISFFISDHQNILPSANIFVEPECPKCNSSTSCFFNSSETTILSPANSKANRSVMSLKTGEISSGAPSLCLFRTHFFSYTSFGSTEVLFIRIFRSIMKLNPAFFKFSSLLFLVFRSHD